MGGDILSKCMAGTSEPACHDIFPHQPRMKESKLALRGPPVIVASRGCIWYLIWPATYYYTH
ncbi:hypothetical protein FH972_023632 [Carpinus fangiana]|uniref:Uncharacterized protein n=1 Tax=Carpinus fangiana TaxID=176857 RepID=A0A5N6KW89_9ROSI|nr:hypothetical protein FH972_023632 [Carpinus fangiana]